MKLARKQEPDKQKQSKKEKRVKKSSSKSFKGMDYSKLDESLFEELRTLRTEIAKEEKVPPYIVFSDKTLTELCHLRPQAEEEMLKVSGVGQFKFNKYGLRFIEAIVEHKNNT
jgi:ATP-dependent DNA helicase RecQ